MQMQRHPHQALAALAVFTGLIVAGCASGAPTPGSGSAAAGLSAGSHSTGAGTRLSTGAPTPASGSAAKSRSMGSNLRGAGTCSSTGSSEPAATSQRASLPPLSGTVVDSRYGFALPVPKGWTVKAADGLPTAEGTHLVLVPPVGGSSGQPITVQVRLGLNLLTSSGAQRVHTTQTTIDGCAGWISTGVPTGSAAASGPTSVQAECERDAYVYVITTSVAPGRAAPPPIFNAVVRAWQWRNPVSVQNPGFVLSSVHMASTTVGWGIRNGVNGLHRWTASSIWRTTDGGVSWTAVSPPALGQQTLEGWTFLGGENAWLAVVPRTQSANTPVAVLRTSDGGATWQTSTLTVPFAGQLNFPISLSFSDASHGWLLVHPEYTMNEKPGELFSTSDGGSQWQMVSRVTFHRDYGYAPETTGLPVGGSVALGRSGAGWLVAGYTSTTPAYLFQTADSGATWSINALPLPAGDGSDGQVTQLNVLQPPTLFSGSSFGYFTGDVYGPPVGGRFLYVTHDGGAHWMLLPLPGSSAQRVITFLGDGHGWLWAPVQDPSASTKLMGGSLYASADAGQSWSALPMDHYIASMLAVGGNITSLAFASAEDGWALLRLPGELNGRLLRTTDGGRHWAPVGNVSTASSVVSSSS